MKPISYNFYGFVTTVAQEWQGSHVGLSVGPCLQVHSFRKCKLNEADLTAISSGWNSQLDIFHWKRLFIIVCGLKTQTCCLFHWVLASGRKDLTSLPLIPPQLQPNCMKTLLQTFAWKSLETFVKGPILGGEAAGTGLYETLGRGNWPIYAECVPSWFLVHNTRMKLEGPWGRFSGKKFGEVEEEINRREKAFQTVEDSTVKWRCLV